MKHMYKINLLFVVILLFVSLPAFSQLPNQEAYDRDKNFEFYIQQAQSYDMAGIYDSALVAYEKAHRLKPGNTEIFNPLTKKYVFLGLFEDAKTRLRELFIDYPEGSDKEMMVWTGSCLTGFYEALEGDYDTALNFTAISMKVTDDIGRYHCAFRVMTAAGAYEKAAQYIDTLLAERSDPRQVVQYAVWGKYVADQLGDPQKAEEYEQMATQIRLAYEQGAFQGMDGPLLRYYLGLIHITEGNLDKAITELRNAYEMGNKEYYWWSNINPILDQLEGMPAYVQLMQEMKSDIDRMRTRYLKTLNER